MVAKIRTGGNMFGALAYNQNKVDSEDAKAIEDNHRHPTPEGDKRAEMLRVPKPDFHEFKQ